MESQRKKIVVGCNTLTNINATIYGAHCQVWFRWGRDFPEYDFIFVAPKRMSIDRMRNQCAAIALEVEAEYLLFYDDDVLFKADDLRKLIDANVDICAGVTFIRTPPFKPMLFRTANYQDDNEDIQVLQIWESYEKDIKDLENPIVQCDAVGFSLCLIDTDILKDLDPPYFVTASHNTEDVYFCLKATQEANARVFFHKEVETAHLVDSYFVDPKNREKLINFEEEIHEYTTNGNTRGKEYRDKLEKRIGASKS